MTDCIVILDGGLLSVMVKERTKSLSKEPYPHPVRSGLGSQVEPLEQPQLQQAKCLTGTEIWYLSDLSSLWNQQAIVL